MEPTPELAKFLQRQMRNIEGSPTHSPPSVNGGSGTYRTMVSRRSLDATGPSWAAQGTLRGTATPAAATNHRMAGSSPGNLGNGVYDGPPRRPSTASCGGSLSTTAGELGFGRPSTASTVSGELGVRPPLAELGVRRPSNGMQPTPSQWTTSDARRNIPTAPATVDGRGCGSLPGTASALIPNAMDRNSNHLESRVSSLAARNEQLTQEVVEIRRRVNKDADLQAFSEEKSRLIVETDELMAETYRIESLKEEWSAQAAAQEQKHQAYTELKSEYAELMSKSEQGKQRNSELSSEILEARAALAAREDTDKLHATGKEEVFELRAKLAEVQQQHEADLRRGQGELERTKLETEDMAHDRLEKAQEANARLQDEVHKLSTAMAVVAAERDRLKEEVLKAAEVPPQQPAIPSGGGSEGRLRAVMTSQGSTSEELSSAIGAVEALVGEARRELERAQLRERRAAYEKLMCAVEKADEADIEEALIAARKAGLPDLDIQKGEDKLQELRSMSEEQKAAKVAREIEAKRKKDAFLFVKKDDAASLQELVNGLEEGVRWMDWRDYAGRTLWKCAQDLRAERVQPILAEMLDIRAPEERRSLRGWKAAATLFERGRAPSVLSNDFDKRSQADSAPLSPAEGASASGLMSRQDSLVTTDLVTDPSDAYDMYDQLNDVPPIVDVVEKSFPTLSEVELAQLKAQALRAVVQDDASTLEDALEKVPSDVWSAWQNKAGKGLVTLSEERGSSLAYGVLAKALGLLQEQKRDVYEERENVWVYVVGDVQPRRATVLQDTPAEDDEILIEYWDGNDDPSYVDRAMVRKDYF